MSIGHELYAEILIDGQWMPSPEIKLRKGVKVPVPYMRDTAQYELYAALIGYEHHWTYDLFYSESIIPLSLPRKFPDDMNPVFKDYFTQGWIEIKGWSTWFMLKDIINYDWDKEFPPFIGYVNSRYSSLFCSSSPFPGKFPKNEAVYVFKMPETVEVSWTQSYRDFVGPLNVDYFLEKLLKLGDPELVRIIFGLTY